MKTKIVHHINKDFTHEIIETQILFMGFVLKRKFSNANLF